MDVPGEKAASAEGRGPMESDQEAGQLERLQAALREAQRTVSALSAELAARDALYAALHEREAYRFARMLVEVKADPKKAWRLPSAVLALVTPRPVRERARRAVAKVTGGPRMRLLRATVALRLSYEQTRMLARPHRSEEVWPADRPLVSVLIPCFNYGRYVREAVDSVLGQTLEDLEIVIVEGGSTDDVTPDVVRQITHPKVRVIFQERPTRVGVNRLTGLRAARGKYAVFLDADDLLEPTYLEKAAMALELTGADIAYPSVRLFGRESWTWETGDEFTLEAMAGCNVVPTVAMFRTETWSRLKIGYGTETEIEPIEDYDFWLRFAVGGARGHKIREALMRYRVHGNSLTDALRHRCEEATVRIRARHGHKLDPKRVRGVSELQRDGSFRPGRAANLARIRNADAAKLRIAVANPFLVVGGSDHLLQQIFSDCAARGASLVVYSTLEPPKSMGNSAVDYAKITPHVFELPKEFPPAAHPDAILHLLRTRGAQILMIVGSRATYELLPRVKAELPGIKVVDHLYNTVGHLASNREFARWIDFHIVANDEVRRALLERGEPAGRVQVIHHGIDIDRFSMATIPRRDDLAGVRLRPQDRLVLYAGRLSEEKGPERFLEIADRLKHLPDTVFAILGDGPLRDLVERRARELGLHERVPRLGFVPDARPYLRRADAVVIPSEIDGLPLVSLEALSLGTPVVASRVGALPEVVEPGVTGAIADPHDVAAFASCIADVLAWPDRQAVARRCSAAVSARFSIAEVRERYFDVFRRLTGAVPEGAHWREAS